MLVLSDDRPTVVVRLFGSPILVTLGKISYGLYLWHFFVLLVVMPHYQRLARLPDRGRYPIVVSISIVVAIISYMFIERPSVRVGRQLATELSERARRRRGEPNLLLPA
jgi:peptidoglycan/LPS O-acetylase OafA/YrhL